MDPKRLFLIFSGALFVVATGGILMSQVGEDDDDPINVQFKRGDSNGDGSVNIADPIHTLNHLFPGDGPPSTPPLCLDAMDSNDDGRINIADAGNSLNYLFGTDIGRIPGWGECAFDGPSVFPDPLTCQHYGACPGGGEE